MNMPATAMKLKPYREWYSHPTNVGFWDERTVMEADELLRRYAAGERDFRKVDLSRANLNRANLIGINLSGANLSSAKKITPRMSLNVTAYSKWIARFSPAFVHSVAGFANGSKNEILINRYAR